MHDAETNAKNIRLGLLLGGIALFMFLVMVLWAWQYINLLPS